MVVLDTSAVIDVVDGTEIGEKIKEKCRNDEILVTSISVNEALANTKGEEHEAFMNFFSLCRIIPFDSSSAYESVRLERFLAQNGNVVGKMDLFIASICITHNLPLITLDGDFKRIPGLNVTVI